MIVYMAMRTLYNRLNLIILNTTYRDLRIEMNIFEYDCNYKYCKASSSEHEWIQLLYRPTIYHTKKTRSLVMYQQKCQRANRMNFMWTVSIEQGAENIVRIDEVLILNIFDNYTLQQNLL